MNKVLGSKDFKKLFESYGSEDANKESVTESKNASIINHIWDTHFKKIQLMIHMTRTLPLISIT
jgi:hypothetical protein